MAKAFPYSVPRWVEGIADQLGVRADDAVSAITARACHPNTDPAHKIMIEGWIRQDTIPDGPLRQITGHVRTERDAGRVRLSPPSWPDRTP